MKIYEILESAESIEKSIHARLYKSVIDFVLDRMNLVPELKV